MKVKELMSVLDTILEFYGNVDVEMEIDDHDKCVYGDWDITDIECTPLRNSKKVYKCILESRHYEE